MSGVRRVGVRRVGVRSVSKTVRKTVSKTVAAVGIAPRTLAGGLLAASLWSIHACGDDAAPTDAATAAAAPEPEPETAPTPDVPPAPPPWTPGITVTEPGKAPAPLARPQQLGDARPIVVVVEASRTKKKRGRRWPKVRITGRSTLTSASNEATRRTLALQTLDATPSKAFDETMIATLTGQLPVGESTVELTTDGNAATTSLPWPPSGAASQAQEIGHAVAHAMSHLTLPMPAAPIGIKGRLEIRRVVDLMGLPMQQTLTLRLDKVAGNQIELAGDVHYALDPEAKSADCLGVTGVTDAQGDGKFFLRLHVPSATPIEMNIVVDLTVEGPDGQARTWLDLRVDEDYLAIPDRRIKLWGEVTQGGLVIGRVAPGTKVWFRRKKTRVSKEGDFVIGFGRNAKDRALLGLKFPGGDIERHVLQVAPRDFPDERIDGLPPDLIKLDKETKKALAASKRQVKKVRGKVTREPYFAGGFAWPLKGRKTSTYGRRRFLNGEDRGPHWGVDLAAPVGKPVKAPAAGVVVLAERNVPLSGNLLIVDHGHGLTSSFLHLHRFRAKVGDVVKAGQVIATSGNSGRSTGPHLDWRMNLGETRVDPETIVDRH